MYCCHTAVTRSPLSRSQIRARTREGSWKDENELKWKLIRRECLYLVNQRWWRWPSDLKYFKNYCVLIGLLLTNGVSWLSLLLFFSFFFLNFEHGWRMQIKCLWDLSSQIKQCGSVVVPVSLECLCVMMSMICCSLTKSSPGLQLEMSWRVIKASFIFTSLSKRHIDTKHVLLFIIIILNFTEIIVTQKITWLAVTCDIKLLVQKYLFTFFVMVCVFSFGLLLEPFMSCFLKGWKIV